jgi:septum formation protein
MPARRLVLASTSRYRSELLQRLRLSFTVRAPGVDEEALPDEAPRALAFAWRWPRPTPSPTSTATQW